MSEKPTCEELECRLKVLENHSSEHRHDEAALRQLEETYAGLVEASLTGIYINQDNMIVFVNRRFAEVYCYHKDELIGMKSWKLVHPDDRALTNERREKRLRGVNRCRPSMRPEDLGLSAALHWLIEDADRRYGIHADCGIDR